MVLWKKIHLLIVNKIILVNNATFWKINRESYHSVIWSSISFLEKFFYISPLKWIDKNSFSFVLIYIYLYIYLYIYIYIYAQIPVLWLFSSTWERIKIGSIFFSFYIKKRTQLSTSPSYLLSGITMPSFIKIKSVNFSWSLMFRNLMPSFQ